VHGEDDPPAEEGKVNQGNCAPVPIQITNRISWMGTYTAAWSQNH
jgi:hypothetical protein